MSYNQFSVNIYEEFYKILEQIPEGMVSTYGDIAEALGDKIASRAVGEMLSENKDPMRYPCHRVVKSDGGIGGFTHPSGVEEKIRKLKKEGIDISSGKVLNFSSLRFSDFKSDYPLMKYREWVNKLEPSQSKDVPDRLRSADISYRGNIGIGVAVNFDNELTFEIKIRRVKSPYIPNYLYLREGEIYESLIDRDYVNIIDGNGSIHRDLRGIASVVGMTTDSITVGLAKSLLTGNLTGDRIEINGVEVGKEFNSFFISRGNGISLENAFTILTSSKFFPHTKTPDRLARRYKNEILSL